MTLLVIETALGALSVALLDGERVVAEQHRIVGRGHAETILPAVAAVMAGQPAPTGILVDVGPGSFTGLRIGIAAARALGLAWAVPVVGCASTALIAAAAFADDPALAHLAVVLDAGRGQVYFQRFGEGPSPLSDVVALAPADAGAAVPNGVAIAGPGAALLLAHGAFRLSHANEPRAADARHLPVAMRMLAPTPLYLRAPDAKAAA